MLAGYVFAACFGLTFPSIGEMEKMLVMFNLLLLFFSTPCLIERHIVTRSQFCDIEPEISFILKETLQLYFSLKMVTYLS